MAKEALVARIGKPHGLRGEVTVQAHTDVPAERFVPGTVFATQPERGALTLRSARLHQGIWLLGFEEAADRTAAEALRRTRLVAHVDLDDPDDDDDAWYAEELVGLPVRDVDGAVIGEVTDLVTRPAQDLLQVRLRDGRTGLVPFVEALVPSVQAGAGAEDPHVVLDAPDGLFDLG
ncbi:16S rRNA processing protein RimM [Kineosphaera limosa]|uniref:Ribosome maturation factor RimM n=1 Tax=Kineosphaera limosa NBRC 100340 TaxID=1184609 RepID=K6WR65_9MICO|nr:ribosome maturation factor RimM [Kineosphaera limosa]NYD99421.1 16S rRNA processing protein RimM [Kineosphaera limosa]GAB94597.1 ribosome maturation factor RimM [Kineosphaera limosa NBRC 100340]